MAGNNRPNGLRYTTRSFSDLVTVQGYWIGLFILGLILYLWRVSQVWEISLTMVWLGVLFAVVTIGEASLALYGTWSSEKAKICLKLGCRVKSYAWAYWLSFSLLGVGSSFAWTTIILYMQGGTVNSIGLLTTWGYTLICEAVSAVNSFLWSYLIGMSFSQRLQKEMAKKMAGVAA